MKTLLLPNIPDSLGKRPTDDAPLPLVKALTRALETRGLQGDVTTLTHAEAARDSAPAVRLAWRMAGPDAALAVMGFLRRRDFDAVFTGSEGIGLFLAALFRIACRRPAHVSIAHRLSRRRRRWLIRSLGLKNGMDALFVHAQAQRDFAEDRLGMASESLALIPPAVDDHFFRPDTQAAVWEDHVCAAGLQWRDYATLLEAVTAMPDLHVDLAAYPAPLRLQDVPAQALMPGAVPEQAVRCDYLGLRALYARSLFVVVPLCDTDFAAGATTILQAMAMGKAVIATRTEGQTDVIVEGVTGLTVPPGDVAGWRQAIARLREDGALRERLGRNARRWVEDNAALDVWADRVAHALYASSSAGVVPALGMDPKRVTLHSLL